MLRTRSHQRGLWGFPEGKGRAREGVWGLVRVHGALWAHVCPHEVKCVLVGAGGSLCRHVGTHDGRSPFGGLHGGEQGL